LRARLQAAIDKKVEGQEISISETAPPSAGKVIDLMEALRASLAKTESAKSSAAELGPRKAPKRVEQQPAAAAPVAAKPAKKATRK
jgi:DNA end-binding protein Ku